MEWLCSILNIHHMVATVPIFNAYPLYVSRLSPFSSHSMYATRSPLVWWRGLLQVSCHQIHLYVDAVPASNILLSCIQMTFRFSWAWKPLCKFRGMRQSPAIPSSTIYIYIIIYTYTYIYMCVCIHKNTYIYIRIKHMHTYARDAFKAGLLLFELPWVAQSNLFAFSLTFSACLD